MTLHDPRRDNYTDRCGSRDAASLVLGNGGMRDDAPLSDDEGVPGQLERIGFGLIRARYLALSRSIRGPKGPDIGTDRGKVDYYRSETNRRPASPTAAYNQACDHSPANGES